MTDLPTIFKETAVGLAKQLREAAVDHAAFEKEVSVCDLANCRATCCHDGAILSIEEAEVLARLDDREGIERAGNRQAKTRTMRADDNDMAEDFPQHFARTRCVYLDGQHRCYWQLKATAEGRHPWFYKPVSCWMHPVLLTQREQRPFLTILSREDDTAAFASHTPCGKAVECAKPARLSLGAELEMLGAISGRDFMRELNAPSVS